VAPGDYDEVRWGAADALNFFGDALRGVLFSAGRCVPVVRGWGESQPGVVFLRDRLRDGDWVHLFPEGGRTREAGVRLRRPSKGASAGQGLAGFRRCIPMQDSTASAPWSARSTSAASSSPPLRMRTPGLSAAEECGRTSRVSAWPRARPCVTLLRRRLEARAQG